MVGIHLRMECAVLTLSAPCPPWSNASSQSGLFDPLGLLLPQAILTLRILRPSVVVVEQVNGFASHSHKQLCIDCFKHVGYSLKWFRILDASVFGACERMRWLGLAVRTHDEAVSFSSFQLWPSISQQSPESLGAFVPEFRDDPQLQISQQAKQLGSDFVMLPGYLKSKLRGAPAKVIWSSRCKAPNQVAKTFMSRYGQQHCLATKTLKERGYLAHFLTDVDAEGSSHDRYYHPIEIIMMHITTELAFVADRFTDSWPHIGICICVPHALVLLSNGLNCIQHIDNLDVHDVFHGLLDRHLNKHHLVELTNAFGTIFLDPRWITMNQQASIELRLKHMNELIPALRDSCLPIGQADEMTIKPLNTDLPRKDAVAQVLATLGGSAWFDQFGNLGSQATLANTVMIVDEPIMAGPLLSQPYMLLAAAKDVRTSAVWDMERACMTITILGESTEVTTMSQFWSNVIHEDSLKALGQSCVVSDIPGGAKVMYQPCDANFILPVGLLQQCLQIAATRCLLSSLVTEDGVLITLKLRSSVLWHGKLHSGTSIEVLLALLDVVYNPFLGEQQTRIIHQGRVVYRVGLDELMRLSSLSHVRLHLEFGQSGGTGNKEQLQTYVKNALAATLLEQGFPLPWTSSTIDQLVQSIGVKKLTQFVAMPAGQARLDQLLQFCRNCAITIPETMVKDASKVSAKGTQITKDRKRQAVNMNPSDYALELTYLRNEDGSPPVQIQEVSPQPSGIVLVSLGDATPWLREDRVICKDELTLAIVGHHKLETKLQTSQCTLPCVDRNGRAVIIAATLCHLGERKIQPVSTAQHVDQPDCATLALTVWRDEWNEADWTKALDKTFPFFKGLLAHNGLDSFVESMWGRSIRGDQKQTNTKMHAISVQIHASVKVAHLSEILKASGFCKLYATPKSAEGRLDASWRVIWVEGDRAHLHSLATQTVGCAGLIRNQRTWGLRFSVDHFPDAWKLIHGTKPLPDDMRIVHLFRVEPLPHGSTGEMLTAWSKVLKWNLRPIKALGPRCWLVGADSLPPAGLHTFNSNPILIKQVQPRHQPKDNPILAGPKPTKPSNAADRQAQDPWGPHFDPWHVWNSDREPAHGATSHAAAPGRATQGPIDARFAEQDTKISKIENALSQLQSAQQQMKAETEQGFAAVAHREQQLEAALGQVRHDLEKSFTCAIKEQSSQLNSSLDDLKALILARSKRGRGEQAAEEDAEMSDH
eukprot:Skav207839  [mRNA]  locus=scaffold3025:79789:83796:+ [translate_table: standard]